MNYKKLAALIIVAIAGFITQNQKSNDHDFKKAPSQKQTTRRAQTQKYILTRHAKCRMDCRNIDDRDIKDILSYGKQNFKKSKPSKKPCPIKALEGHASKDKQHIRVIAAICPSKTKIVTVIDLDNKYDCYCK